MATQHLLLGHAAALDALDGHLHKMAEGVWAQPYGVSHMDLPVGKRAAHDQTHVLDFVNAVDWEIYCRLCGVIHLGVLV